ncbi:sulfite exporter TauE/SafE family protein (plasmid) [Agrobacterium sp. rho-13.3]|uniref:sulfite exporter TauE/SafE family protein n=1 Tax=Agrobacterium sp. rho-13.3 TaxID=3072980 RepID=UPI002A1841DC|nr:sulfite exporter TauE/SafE family protein [Agrobacterium sp. rho-13.3]MDX8310272.1 sulfite exporter TauE/SafE family protein [Agrobacterium sp. rho-13.3]
MDHIYLVVILGAVAAGLVQGISGFAFGLVAMSFWAWVLDPRLAATLAVFGALFGQILAVVTTRRGFDLKLLIPFILGGLAGIPIGVKILPHLDIDAFRAILGGLLVLWCPAMLLATRLPKLEFGGRFGDGVAGLAGGIMGGIGGFTGTLPTLWCIIRGFPKDMQRGIIQNFNLSMLLVTMGTYLATGIVTSEMLPFFAVVATAMIVPTLLGAKLYVGMTEAQFRQVVLGLLTLSGIALLASAIPNLVWA